MPATQGQMMVIRVSVAARLSSNGKPPTGNAIESSVKQCVADAIDGSFGEYPKHLKRMVRMQAERLGDVTQQETDTYTEVRFAIALPAELFPVDNGGLQLLVNLLSGDMFPGEVSGCRWSDVTVSEVELPSELRSAAVASFRQSKAHDIASIRSTFKLADGWPLLAFSLKPRVGPTFEEIRRITLDVLAQGFNIVELDTRHLALSSAPIERWLELGVEAAQVGSHVTAFSPNFSIPAPSLIDVTNAWVDEVAKHGPPVLKVDGGLDGLTSLQSVRKGLGQGPPPIITCYPLLRNQLSSAIGPQGWTDLLALSGADIVYPGGRPTFPKERRPVWGSHTENWVRAGDLYDRIIKRGWPMPTIAGGIHPGHLHACYELVGPNVAYFLGGAVALHPTSVAEGAKFCHAVLADAIDLAEEAKEDGRDFAEMLGTRNLRRLENTRYPSPTPYSRPEDIFGATDSDAPRTFYRRAE